MMLDAYLWVLLGINDAAMSIHDSIGWYNLLWSGGSPGGIEVSTVGRSSGGSVVIMGGQ